MGNFKGSSLGLVKVSYAQSEIQILLNVVSFLLNYFCRYLIPVIKSIESDETRSLIG